MKITIVSDVLGSENNGTTITAKRLISNLEERGHMVRVLSPMPSDKENYYTVPKRSFGPFNEYVRKNGVELAKVDKDIVRKAIEGSDVVHIVLPFKLGIAASEVARDLNIPMTSAFHCQAENVTTHLFLQNFAPANRFVYRRFYRKFYKNQKFVHCPTAFIANVLRENGYDMDLRVISNGVAPEYHVVESTKPEALKDKYCITFVGRLSKEKSHDFLIEAVNKSKYRDKIQLMFAGNGPREKNIVELGKKLPNPPIIGFYKKEELVKILNYCDLYVHPADVEIEAIACLEAITCGLVPIISDSKKSATNSFALHPENLCHAQDPVDLANKIDYMIEHPDVVKKMREEYLEYSKEFKISNCIDKMIKMFEDAIESAKKE